MSFSQSCIVFGRSSNHFSYFTHDLRVLLGRQSHILRGRIIIFNGCKLVIKEMEQFTFAPIFLQVYHSSMLSIILDYLSVRSLPDWIGSLLKRGMGARIDPPVCTFLHHVFLFNTTCLMCLVFLSLLSLSSFSLSLSLCCVADEIVSTLGEGTFGRVMECIDHRRCVSFNSKTATSVLWDPIPMTSVGKTCSLCFFV